MTEFCQLPPLREVIADHQLSARKSLGQNFLLDANITDKIAVLSGELEGHDVLEIGPGPGGLTRSLVRAGARHIVAIEKDSRFITPLNELADCAGNIKIVHDDALESDHIVKLLAAPIKVIANLPFNVATQLLARWLESNEWPPFWQSLTLMFQEDVARRIVAQPGSKSYGRLSIMSQWRTRARIVLKVPAAAFVPRPKVNAVVVQIDRPREMGVDDPQIDQLRELTRAVFGQRRKMLRVSLKKFHAQIDEKLHSMGIAPSTRPERLTIEQFRSLAQTLQSPPH